MMGPMPHLKYCSVEPAAVLNTVSCMVDENWRVGELCEIVATRCVSV